MRGRRRSRSPGNHERWLVSYADFMTLLFAFFTTLYAISVVDAVKAQRLVTSIKQSFGDPPFEGAQSLLEHALGSVIETGEHPTGTPEQRAAGRIESLRLSEGVKDSITVKQTERGLVITLAETLLFESGGTLLSTDAKSAIAQVASILQELPNHVRVEGHTDSRPSSGGPHPTNWHLSAARAVEVLLELGRGGVPGHRLSAAGFGDQRPLASDTTIEGRRMNRRVDLVVVRIRAPRGE